MLKFIFYIDCPSFEECECVKINAFRIRSRKYEGNIIKQKGNYDLNGLYVCLHRFKVAQYRNAHKYLTAKDYIGIF